MSVRRVVIGLEFRVDTMGDLVVRENVTRMLIGLDWLSIGMLPLRSLVTPRRVGRDGRYTALQLPGDRGVGDVRFP